MRNSFISGLILSTLCLAAGTGIVAGEESGANAYMQGDAAATGVRASVKLDKKEIKIGERIRLEVEAHPGKFAVELPDLPATWGSCEVLDQKPASDASAPANKGDCSNTNASIRVMKREFSITAYEVGDITPPAYSLRRLSPGGGWSMQSVVVPSFKVLSSLKNVPAANKDQLVGDAGTTGKLDIEELSTPLDLPAPWRPWLIIAVAIAIIAISALFYFGIRFLEKKRAQAPPPPKPEEVALRALDQLESEGLLQKGEAEQFFVRLTDIMRCYIEPSFGIRAPELTTEEFLRALDFAHDASFVDSGLFGQSPNHQGEEPRPNAQGGQYRVRCFTKAHREMLANFLIVADMIKFARGGVAAEEGASALAAARAFVAETSARVTAGGGNT